MKFLDFLPPIDNSDIALSYGQTLNRKDTYVESFAELYKKEFETYQSVLQQNDIEFTLEQYNEIILRGAAFSYEKDYTEKTFIVDLLNATIIYPLITGLAKYDPIYGYPLTNYESNERITTGVVSAAFTTLTFGLAPVGLSLGENYCILYLILV